MTAEIGILNRNGIALAADSAVTITQGGKLKVLNTANKLFNLSLTEPIGIMIYGNGSYISTPWDIIIKEYRKKRGIEKFDTLKEYADDFFDFLFDFEVVNTEKNQLNLVNVLFTERFDIILNKVNKILYERYEGSKPPVEEVEVLLENEVDEYYNNIRAVNFLEGYELLTYEKYMELFSGTIEGIIQNKVNFELNKDVINKLIKIGYYSVTKDTFINYTGIVIAGYGDKEIFPSLYEYHVNGIVDKFRRYKENDKEIINVVEGNSARIMPFAQQEMVHTVMSGIDPYLYTEIKDIINSVTDISHIMKVIIDNYNLDIDWNSLQQVFKDVGSQINREALDSIENARKDTHIIPILNMVEMLPKDELAVMAETLVNLTSFKRRITLVDETVGGPVDVAVISKTDGFIWIKRKHYFNPDINYNYFNKLKGRINYVFKE